MIAREVNRSVGSRYCGSNFVVSIRFAVCAGERGGRPSARTGIRIAGDVRSVVDDFSLHGLFQTAVETIRTPGRITVSLRELAGEADSVRVRAQCDSCRLRDGLWFDLPVRLAFQFECLTLLDLGGGW